MTDKPNYWARVIRWPTTPSWVVEVYGPIWNGRPQRLELTWAASKDEARTKCSRIFNDRIGGGLWDKHLRLEWRSSSYAVAVPLSDKARYERIGRDAGISAAQARDLMAIRPK